MSTLPSGSEVVNSQPGFYAIIPASVRYCRDIPPATKLLFGEIVALTSVKGYCFAQNPYFMALYGVDRATIKRWLAALVSHHFISVEVDRSTNERRIYALAMLPSGVKNPSEGAARKRATGSAETRHPQRKNALQSITEINKEINTLLSPAVSSGKFVGPGPVPARDLLPDKQEEKGSASPPTVKNPKKVRQVERAIARCGDLSYRDRISELWDAVEEAGREELWQEGMDAVKQAKNVPAGFLGGSAAYFCAFVSSALTRSVGVSSGGGPGG